VLSQIGVQPICPPRLLSAELVREVRGIEVRVQVPFFRAVQYPPLALYLAAATGGKERGALRRPLPRAALFRSRFSCRARDRNRTAAHKKKTMNTKSNSNPNQNAELQSRPEQLGTAEQGAAERQLWCIGYGDREFAKLQGDPVLALVRAATKEEAEANRSRPHFAKLFG
jgi:hypothetical protein